MSSPINNQTRESVASPAVSVVFAAVASGLPVAINFNNYLAIGAVPLAALCAAGSLLFGIASCVHQRRLIAFSMIAPLLVAYPVLRGRMRDPVLLSAERGDGVWGRCGLSGAAGLMSVSILVAIATLFVVLLLGRWRIKRTKSWYLAAAGLPFVCYLWDLYGYEAEADHGHRQFFLVFAFWLIFSGVSFGYVSIAQMLGRPLRSDFLCLLGAVSGVAGVATTASALAARFGLLKESRYDVLRIEVLSRNADVDWLLAMHVVVGVILFAAGWRAIAQSLAAVSPGHDSSLGDPSL